MQKELTGIKSWALKLLCPLTYFWIDAWIAGFSSPPDAASFENTSSYRKWFGNIIEPFYTSRIQTWILYFTTILKTWENFATTN